METVEIDSDEVKFLWNVQLKQKQKSLVFYREIEDSEEDSDVEYLFTRHFYEETESRPILEEETPEPSVVESEEEVVKLSVAEPEEMMIVETPEPEKEMIVKETPEPEEMMIVEIPEPEEEIAEPSVAEPEEMVIVEIPEPEPRRSGRKRQQTDFLVAQKQIKFT